MDVERMLGLLMVIWPLVCVLCLAVDKAIREAREGDWYGAKLVGGMVLVFAWYFAADLLLG